MVVQVAGHTIPGGWAGADLRHVKSATTDGFIAAISTAVGIRSRRCQSRESSGVRTATWNMVECVKPLFSTGRRLTVLWLVCWISENSASFADRILHARPHQSPCAVPATTEMVCLLTRAVSERGNGNQPRHSALSQATPRLEELAPLHGRRLPLRPARRRARQRSEPVETERYLANVRDRHLAMTAPVLLPCPAGFWGQPFLGSKHEPLKDYAGFRSAHCPHVHASLRSQQWRTSMRRPVFTQVGQAT